MNNLITGRLSINNPKLQNDPIGWMTMMMIIKIPNQHFVRKRYSFLEFQKDYANCHNVS